MAKITEGIYFIPGQDESIPDAHTYVIGKPSSGDLSLIDPGLVGKSTHKLQALEKMGIEPKAVRRIIMTHTHLDHIGCLSEIRKQMPWVEVWIHTLEADPLETGDERSVYGMEMFRTMCQMQFGLKAGAFTLQADRKLNGGETLNLGEMVWEVLHIPGHSLGSIALYHAPGKILIPGDVLYADHSIGRFDLHGASAGDLKKSLWKLAEKEVEMLLPGHNQIAQGLSPGYIQKTAKQWEPYLT